jgi:hypothetical protein
MQRNSVTLLFSEFQGIQQNLLPLRLKFGSMEVQIQDSFKQAQPGKTHLLGNSWARKWAVTADQILLDQQREKVVVVCWA